MNIFNNLEKKLEKIIEGNILGRFGGKLQPVEIARTIWLEITAKKMNKKGRVYVPNLYMVSLSIEDYNNLFDIREEIEDEILEYVRLEARERDFKFSGPPVIQWIQNAEVKCGASQVAAAFAKSSELPHEIKKKVETIAELKLPESYRKAFEEKFKKKADKNTGDASADSNIVEKTKEFEETLIKELVPVITVVEGFDKGKIFHLDKDEYIIGRSEDCELNIGDPAISRQHAKLVRDGKDYLLIDMLSGTGTKVNGNKINRAALKADDLIMMGYTTCKYLKLFG
jgi:hypothetical protein